MPMNRTTLMSRRNFASPRRMRGMSLIELVVVIVLIGGVLAVVGAKVVGNKERAEWKLAETHLSTIAGKIEAYESDVGSLPDSLDALVNAPSNEPDWLGPYAKAEELKDPWHKPIQYNAPGRDDAPFELVSFGADGKEGGEGVDKDIVKP